MNYKYNIFANPTLSKIAVIINFIMLALGPVFVLGLLMLVTSFRDFPIWGGGIVLSWAVSINMWVGLGFLMSQTFTPMFSAWFTFVNFLLPIGMALYQKDTLVLSLYKITSFHFLALGIALFILMTIGPFTRKFPGGVNAKAIIARIGWMFFGLIIFGGLLTLPAIASELVFLREMNIAISGINLWEFLRQDWWLAIRYLSIIPVASFIYKILNDEVAF